MSDNAGDSDSMTQMDGAVQRALKRRSEAPVQQAPQPEVEEEVRSEESGGLTLCRLTYVANTTHTHIAFSSQLGFDLDEDLDEVEASGLKSRLKAMQKKLASLEQEKVQLSMAKAPLEARIRQNEDSWNKEKLRFATEIDALKGSIKEADEKFRSLELQKSQVEEENTKLNLENRKANSSVASVKTSADTSAWSRQLANDKDIDELKER